MHKSYPFYNLTHSVGKGGSNYGDDVWLVQYMLTEIANHPTGGGESAPKTKLPINGVYSPLLDDWIFWFQKQVQMHGKPVTVDGRIDPLPTIGNQGFCLANLQGKGWTIVHLNAVYRRRFHNKHDHLEAQPELAGISDRIVKDDFAPA
jgi:hypothetical protein